MIAPPPPPPPCLRSPSSRRQHRGGGGCPQQRFVFPHSARRLLSCSPLLLLLLLVSRPTRRQRTPPSLLARPHGTNSRPFCSPLLHPYLPLNQGGGCGVAARAVGAKRISARLWMPIQFPPLALCSCASRRPARRRAARARAHLLACPPILRGFINHHQRCPSCKKPGRPFVIYNGKGLRPDRDQQSADICRPPHTTARGLQVGVLYR